MDGDQGAVGAAEQAAPEACEVERAAAPGPALAAGAPAGPAQPPVEDSVSDTLIAVLIVAVAFLPLLWLGMRFLARAADYARLYPLRGYFLDVTLDKAFVGTAIVFFALIGLLGPAGHVVPRAQRVLVQARRALLIGTLLALIGLGLVNLVYYQTYAPNGWSDLAHNHGALAGLVGSILFVLYPILPVALMYRYPKLAGAKAFRSFANATFLAAQLSAVIGVWFVDVPVLVQVATLVWSLFAILVGILAVTQAIDLIELLQNSLGLPERIRHSDREWVRWLNRHLPDPDDQQEMAAAYMRSHPQARRKFWFGFLVVSLGSAAAGGAAKGLVSHIVSVLH